MQFEEIDKEYELTEVILVRQPEKEVKLEQVNPNEVIIPNAAIIQGGGIIAFVVFWTGFLLIVSRMMKITRENQIIYATNSYENLPCKNCQFFAANNHYLKCAVQPSLVLTEEANSCSDYCAKQSNLLPKNKFKFWK
jgi:hypothetical protein